MNAIKKLLINKNKNNENNKEKQRDPKFNSQISR